ncbi:activator of 90 kDa heat shock protein ATPase homolog 1a isoform X2 [Clupea harengus]|uniref:Activator of 90 kDa heat shock protein ATPase homolog 1a isoform X2 n=1 Tax=Clupea harengus TaxID=7950 RepID=A0A6P8GI34_CLUHA|nr:activator of 90 kDa heat shock protein ATPase homolog 1a isoform X2 [Clupea harengus]
MLPTSTIGTERDVTDWSTNKLKGLLMGVRVEGDQGTCEVTAVDSLEGEASINNRKGKLIHFYEWHVKATWTGTTKSGIKYKGSIEVPNLSDENDMDDLDISIGLCKDEPQTPLADLMKKEGARAVRLALGSYISLLKTEFSQGMILPTVNGVPSAKQEQPAPPKAKMDKTQAGSSTSASSKSAAGVKIPTCKFSLKDTFLTAPEELFRVFVNHEMVRAFTHDADAVVENQRGGKFRLLDGNVSGEFLDLVPDEKIVMKWRFKTWPCEHYATVTLTLKDKGDETDLHLEARGVPTNEEERTKEGWQRYYFEGIKQTFGFGARLY